MLGDMDVAVKRLSQVYFKLIQSSSSDSALNGKKEIRITSHPTLMDFYVVEVELPAAMFHQLPASLQNGQLIEVFPVLFTQGINEQQTIANTIGDTSLQETINNENYPLLESYYEMYKMFISKRVGKEGFEKLRGLEKRLDSLDYTIKHPKKKKEINIINKASKITRALNGGRATSCKSAKDRTAMSITLEQARILRSEHQLKEDIIEVANEMRTRGTRRENAWKNVGKDRYAFNALQNLLLPEMYRAPSGTGGADIT
eukprot:TRINITY_DN6173_c0_g1_i2.p1 TRINITY_DN6173_c0_g1~~TRINITY_DN6173_c0_g1_i2.p1  ORF type:complete len:258 (+),score=55.13 TRINITY_DN6173_c0_g1_i2:158-931(+)